MVDWKGEVREEVSGSSFGTGDTNNFVIYSVVCDKKKEKRDNLCVASIQ